MYTIKASLGLVQDESWSSFENMAFVKNGPNSLKRTNLIKSALLHGQSLIVYVDYKYYQKNKTSGLVQG